MASADKEKILVELRAYHTTPFADSLSSDAVSVLRHNFADLEDEIVSSILNLVNGKAEYVSYDKQLSDQKKKVVKLTDIEQQEKELFLQKIEQLGAILAAAEQAQFKMRPARFRKPAK